MVEQESKYRRVFVMSKSVLAKPSESRVYKTYRDVDKREESEVRWQGLLSRLAEPSNALRKKEHLADYWIYLCVDSHFRI